MDLKEFFIEFQDHMAPKLDTYEQTIYLYLFRHSHLKGTKETVISLKSSPKKIATGIGKAGSPISENTCSEKLRSLEKKGLRKSPRYCPDGHTVPYLASK